MRREELLEGPEPRLLTPELVSQARATRPDRLSRVLRGDLDNIILMALRKQPERRYASVEQFSADIQRYLDGLPVIARHDTVRYRTLKFAQRHTIGLVATLLVFLSLIAGVIATTWQARVANRERARAEERFNEVRGLAHAVLFDLHDMIVKLPGSTAARAMLVQKAQNYLDNLSGDSALDPGLQQERALAYERIGDVLGLPTMSNLGRTGQAIDSYRKALEIERSLVKDNSNDVQLQRNLARVNERLCTIQQSSGGFRGALDTCQAAADIRAALSARNPADILLRGELAASYQSLAGAYFIVGDWVHCEKYRTLALETFEQLHQSEPRSTRSSGAAECAGQSGPHLRAAAAGQRLAVNERLQRSTRGFQPGFADSPGDVGLGSGRRAIAAQSCEQPRGGGLHTPQAQARSRGAWSLRGATGSGGAIDGRRSHAHRIPHQPFGSP